MIRASAGLALMFFALGCESGEQPARGAHRGVEPVQYAPPPPQAPREEVDAPRPDTSVDLPELAEPGEQEAERDLDAELRQAIGVPTYCVRDFTAPRPTKLRVSVAAIVRPTGMVITPSVYGSGLSSAARQCFERLVETVVLEPLEEPVSQPVSTVVEIDYTPEVIVEADPGVPKPRLRNVQEPLPPRPDIPLSGEPVAGWPAERWVSGGFDGGIQLPFQDPRARKVTGPKPRPIDGYDVDENAQEWR